MNVNDLKVGMTFKTTTGHISKIKSIDSRFPLDSEEKFPIIYSDDNKTCWGLDKVEEVWK